MDVELTILMPCLNEAKTLPFCIDEARRFLGENNVCGEILIADNGSTDGSAELARQCGARVVCVSERGYGNALRGGIAAALGKYIIIGDCDMSYDFYRLGGFLEKLRGGCKLVVGNRFAGGIEAGAMPFSHRYFGIPFLSWVGRIRYKTKVRDFHCGLRGFDREAAQSLGLRCEGMEFASELIGRFALNGYEIDELPTTLRRDGRGGKSHLRAFPDGMRHLRFMLGNSVHKA